MKKKKQPNYKSNYEREVASLLGTNVLYESTILYYEIPQTFKKYIPDFDLGNDIYIETKGRWTSEDRKKHLYIREQYPTILVILLFQDASKKITKTSKTSYADWATKHNLYWLDYKTIKGNLNESIKDTYNRFRECTSRN